MPSPLARCVKSPIAWVLGAREVRQAKEQASKAISAFDQEKGTVETEIQLRHQSDARLESLQQQVNLLLQKQVAKK